MISLIPAAARDTWTGSPVEPSIDDILSDPIIRLVLRRDGLTVGTVRAQLDKERRRLGFLSEMTLDHAA
jgi:hypothetical protein